MKPILYKSTNNPADRINFETALLRGLAPDYGLYTVAREDIPVLTPAEIAGLKGKSYAEIAFRILAPYLASEIPEEKLRALLQDAYQEDRIPTDFQHVTGKTHIMWLTKGPTYSFKDYAARFFGRALNFFLGRKGLRRVVVVATSGDTGGAVVKARYIESCEGIFRLSRCWSRVFGVRFGFGRLDGKEKVPPIESWRVLYTTGGAQSRRVSGQRRAEAREDALVIL